MLNQTVTSRPLGIGYPFTPPAQIRSNPPLTPTLSRREREFRAGGVNGYGIGFIQAR